MNQINNLTSNQYYGGINRRYDSRVKILLRAGFYWNKQKEMWQHKRHFNYKGGIHNSVVMHCDKRHFMMLLVAEYPLNCWRRN